MKEDFHRRHLCKCSVIQQVYGEGCRYCRPQDFIDRMMLNQEKEKKHGRRVKARMNRALKRSYD